MPRGSNDLVKLPSYPDCVKTVVYLPMALDEYELIERLRRRAAGGLDVSVRVGIGDDTAVVTPPRRGEETLLTTDQVVENTHFLRGIHPPDALGHKCLARGLSDIAAMGGRARHFLLSLCLPAWATEKAWMEAFCRGLFRLSASAGAALVGGDVSRADRFAAHVTVVGSVAKGKALQRSGARPGDIVYVSGRLGGSWLGFERIRKRLRRKDPEPKDPAVQRHLYPEPRLALGRFLRRRLTATSAIDLSDGLSRDLGRLAKAGGVGAEIQAENVPCFPEATLEQALHGGEEYELLFTVPPEVRVPRRTQGVPLTAIGVIRVQKQLVLVSDGRRSRLRPLGFEHLDH